MPASNFVSAPLQSSRCKSWVPVRRMPCSRELPSNKRGCGGAVSTQLPGFRGTGRAREVANTKRGSKSSPTTTFIYSKIHLEPLLLLSPFLCSMLWEPGTCKLAWRQSEEMTGEQGRADPGMRREQLELKHHLRYPVLSLHCRMLTHSYLLCASSFLCLEHYVAILQRLSQINSWLIFSERYFLRKDFPDLLGTLSFPLSNDLMDLDYPSTSTGKFEISNFSIKAARS